MMRSIFEWFYISFISAFPSFAKIGVQGGMMGGGGAGPTANPYVAENNTDTYVAENNTDQYVTET